MDKIINQIYDLPLFHGIEREHLAPMLNCIGYYIKAYQKNETISLEKEHIRHIGIILSGSVDMIKEDLWGNKTIVTRMHSRDLFGETFACGSNPLSVVSYTVSQTAQILFLPFKKVMHTCTNTCFFHHHLIENMVRLIADKNRDLMCKVEMISKKTLREKILAYLSLQAQINKTRYFEIPLGRVELADYLCADRSALTRELSKMKAEGLIDFDKNTFRIQ